MAPRINFKALSYFPYTETNRNPPRGTEALEQGKYLPVSERAGLYDTFQL